MRLWLAFAFAAVVALACAPGNYAFDGVLCFVCPAGYYCPDGERIAQCPPGKRSLAGEIACHSNCPYGHVADYDDPRACVGCPARHYAYNDNLPCFECGTGAWSLPLSGVCTEACPNGYACTEFTQTPCPPGTHKSDPHSHTCVACEANTFAAWSGSVECAPCPDGRASGAGATECLTQVND